VPSVVAITVKQAAEIFFANSLMLTHIALSHDFHLNNNKKDSSFVYGLWWSGYLQEDASQWALDKTCGHSLIKCGAPIWKTAPLHASAYVLGHPEALSYSNQDIW
jgi:hypothetical protein